MKQPGIARVTRCGFWRRNQLQQRGFGSAEHHTPGLGRNPPETKGVFVNAAPASRSRSFNRTRPMRRLDWRMSKASMLVVILLLPTRR